METLIHPPRTLMEVFKGLPEGTLAQLIENELIMSPAPTGSHQRILGKIFNALYNFAEEKNAGTVWCAPYDVYLDSSNAFQPDIIFIANENAGIIKEDGVQGAPDLIIEILSPGTAKNDKNKKKDVYERCGVREYWIIDPTDKSATGYFLENRKFIQLDKFSGVIRSKLLQATLSF